MGGYTGHINDCRDKFNEDPFGGSDRWRFRFRTRPDSRSGQEARADEGRSKERRDKETRDQADRDKDNRKSGSKKGRGQEKGQKGWLLVGAALKKTAALSGRFQFAATGVPEPDAADTAPPMQSSPAHSVKHRALAPPVQSAMSCWRRRSVH